MEMESDGAIECFFYYYFQIAYFTARFVRRVNVPIVVLVPIVVVLH